VDRSETFAGRWVPGLLALYTELNCERGMTRALNHLLNRNLGDHTAEAQWPMELVFMVEAALPLCDREAVHALRPRTVKTHLTHVYTKLGLTSRVQLVQEAARHA